MSTIEELQSVLDPGGQTLAHLKNNDHGEASRWRALEHIVKRDLGITGTMAAAQERRREIVKGYIDENEVNVGSSSAYEILLGDAYAAYPQERRREIVKGYIDDNEVHVGSSSAYGILLGDAYAHHIKTKLAGMEAGEAAAAEAAGRVGGMSAGKWVELVIDKSRDAGGAPGPTAALVAKFAEVAMAERTAAGAAPEVITFLKQVEAAAAAAAEAKAGGGRKRRKSKRRKSKKTKTRTRRRRR